MQSPVGNSNICGDLVYDKLGIHISEEELSGLFSDDVITQKSFGESNKSTFLSVIPDTKF